MYFIVQGYPINHEGGSPPSWGGGWGGGPRPDQGLPGWSGPVDPGWGQGHPGGHPGNRPPGSWGGPVDPGWGGGPPDHAWRPGHRPPMPGQGLPPSWGIRPDIGGPGDQPGIDNTLPGHPGHPSHQPVPGATPHGTAVATAPPDKVDATNGAWVLVDVQGTLVWAWAQSPKHADASPPTGDGAPPATGGTLPGQTPQPKK